MQDKKRTMDEVMDYLARFIKIRNSVKTKVGIKRIAAEIGIECIALRQRKNRGKIPHEHIINYCFKVDINPLNVFFDRKIKP